MPNKCSYCEEIIIGMPYKGRDGKLYCSKHILPENRGEHGITMGQLLYDENKDIHMPVKSNARKSNKSKKPKTKRKPK